MVQKSLFANSIFENPLLGIATKHCFFNGYCELSSTRVYLNFRLLDLQKDFVPKVVGTTVNDYKTSKNSKELYNFPLR